jgi:HSP20 family protein
MAEQVAKKEASVPVRRTQGQSGLAAMREMMDRWMDDLFQEWPMLRLRPFEWRTQEFMPTVDVIDEEKQIRINAEAPGMGPGDIEVTLSGNNAVTISGEKKWERKEQGEDVHYSERSYGSFRRSIPLPMEVDPDKVEATFKNGVLSIVLPKSPRAIEQTKKIEIKTG